jgi:hypothetical protein
MKRKPLQLRLNALVLAAGFVFAAGSANSRAADETPSTGFALELAGSVQVAGKPLAGATVTLYAAGTGAPEKLSEAKTDDQGQFKLDARHAPRFDFLSH